MTLAGMAAADNGRCHAAAGEWGRTSVLRRRYALSCAGQQDWTSDAVAHFIFSLSYAVAHFIFSLSYAAAHFIFSLSYAAAHFILSRPYAVAD